MMPMLPDTADLLTPKVWQDVLNRHSAYGFGGYIVFRGDWHKTPPLLASLQEHSEIPLVFGSDLERGCGQQLTGATVFPMQMALGATRNSDLAYQQGAITALEARRAGLHWIFAPTLDLVTRPDNPIINVRGLGENPRLVGRLGSAVIAGMQEHGAIACAKHFPGHAETSDDSHTRLPTLHISRQRMEWHDLVPFRDCIRAGLQTIMVGHLAVPALDDTGMPASLSRRIVTDLLREQMNFDGLIVTDALDMGAITARFDPGQAAVRALQAGVDVLLMPPDPEAVVNAILLALEEGVLSRRGLLDSVERLDRARLQLGLYSSDGDDDLLPVAHWPDYTPAVKDIATHAITLVHSEGDTVPLRGSVAAIALDDDNDPTVTDTWVRALESRHGVSCAVLDSQATPEAINDVLEQASQSETVVVGVFSAVRAWKNRVTLVKHLDDVGRRLSALACKRRVVVSFSSPFMAQDWAGIDAYICAYSPHPLCQLAALDCLWGLAPFKGHLPVTLDNDAAKSL
jgi:beta-N-acetylhexosaminidase